ncbi:MAG: hypothetical protein JJU00_00895 [Opitutales bacterium]|nr:hypothetical protein [Opitutales bacterium]
MKHNPLFGKITLVAACLFFGAGNAFAQDELPVQESVFTAAVTTESSGQAWAYILWQSNVPQLMETKTYSIWSKPGTASSPAAMSRVAVVGLQIDPLAVSALIDRATLALDENVAALENTIDNLFEDLAAGSISLPDKVAGVIFGALAEERHVENLLLAARRFPALNMALGQAAALPIPSSGPVTFEVREHDPVRDRDLGVVGRVTVDHADPVLIPGPDALVVTPDDPRDGYNNMNLKFAWDTPDPLRRVLLMTQGYNLYRVDKDFAEAQDPDWSVESPAADELASLVEAMATEVARVNDGPITPNRMLSTAELGTIDHTVAFFVDEETRFPGYPAMHTPPKNGDQFYYFVTVRDLLGRDVNSGVSPAVLGTFCDTIPPPTPRGMRVTNEYTWDGGADEQILRLHWRANDNSGEKKTTAYFIYRWQRSDDPYRYGGDPLANLVAGPIWPGPGETQLSWDDPGPYDASTGLTYDNTVWYTIRSSDDGTLSQGGATLCFDPPFYNLSGHSPPVPGVLRDRVGPDSPDATIFTWCFRPEITGERADVRQWEQTDEDFIHYRLVASREAGEHRITAIEFQQIMENQDVVSHGTVHFAKGSDFVERWVKDLRADADHVATFRARAHSSFGRVSQWETIVSEMIPAPREFLEFPWHAFGAFDRIPYADHGRDCRAHAVPPPGYIGIDEDPWIQIQFFPVPTMRQYKIYYRVDNGPLTLAEEGSGEYDPAEELVVPVKLLPASAASICLFLQVFDLNGNPSRMQRLGCLDIQGSQPIATPMMKPIRSDVSGTTPVAKISWVCPPYGVERFRLWIAATPEPVFAVLSDLIYDDSTNPPPNLVSEPVGGGNTEAFNYHSFDTELIGPEFGTGAQFSIELPVMFGSQMRVKVAAITPGGEIGPWSNAEDFEWQPAPEFTGPDVPWPARPLPGVGSAGSFDPRMEAIYLDERATVGVRIGEIEGLCQMVEREREFIDYRISREEALDVWLFKREYGSPAVERSVLPVMLYRTQVPDGNLYPDVPGDVVQVSPLMETIIDIPGENDDRFILDPFVYVETSRENERFCDLYLLDTQPQVSGAHYAYMLALFDEESKEMLHIIPLGTVAVP